MRIDTRTIAIATAAFLGSMATPCLAQSYGSAANTAYTLGATASPALESGPVMERRDPGIAAANQDVATTGSIARARPSHRTHAHRR